MHHKTIIGTQVLVEYFDQNEEFENIFPLKGKFVQKIKIGSRYFFVVQFDKPFVYKGNHYDKIVITERHAGYYIGVDKEVHVHVLLPKKELKQEKYQLTDFDHVVWATIKTCESENKKQSSSAGRDRQAGGLAKSVAVLLFRFLRMFR